MSTDKERFHIFFKVSQRARRLFKVSNGHNVDGSVFVPLELRKWTVSTVPGSVLEVPCTKRLHTSSLVGNKKLTRRVLGQPIIFVVRFRNRQEMFRRGDVCLKSDRADRSLPLGMEPSKPNAEIFSVVVGIIHLSLIEKLFFEAMFSCEFGVTPPRE